ncbi:LOW QUALITY PROTEIN: acylcarnitine hydrolase-like [Pollicipes pollicipes]|uniref:LOW QUALITY PROTEIN: acylcarnitine hydrolase-like n=1 Tax=Pollicipes pollicipes TaxID=41117 RepID=UPI0018852959|nr:LOW QUALITY PROTEIN: acylcarnitine hydrolase-like [Pollicipes pollicipes]
MRALLVLAWLAMALAERPVVRFEDGELRGFTLHSFDGRQYAAFKGIPYARPPVGDLRLRPPRAHPGWSGVRDAARHGSTCLQYNMMRNFTMEGQEDCLFVNVYSPRLPAGDGEPRLPVMVWIHGGGFVSGSGDADIFGADFLMDEDVVVVTLNYRLNVFGFFTTDDAEAPGNIGLLDQVLALHWVRSNIARFGGDPQLVTLFGESAGGASVSLQVISPLSAGLFHRAVSQSGSASSCWALGGQQRLLALHLAAELGCPSEESRAVLECVRRAPAADIMRVLGALASSTSDLPKRFHPRVDGDAASPFLPAEPNVLLQRGQFSHVPWMMGCNQDEGLFLLTIARAREEAFRRAQAGDLEAWVSEELMGGGGISGKMEKPLDVAAKIRDFFGSRGDAAVVDLLSDRFFILALSAEADLASQHVPVYKYVLDHVGAGQLRFSDLLQVPAPSASNVTHGDDLAYLFHGDQQPLPERGSLWTSFARRGYPATDVLDAPAWPIFTAQSQRHLRLNAAPSLGARAFEERVRFWRSLPLAEPWNAHERSSIRPRDEL